MSWSDYPLTALGLDLPIQFIGCSWIHSLPLVYPNWLRSFVAVKGFEPCSHSVVVADQQPEHSYEDAMQIAYNLCKTLLNHPSKHLDIDRTSKLVHRFFLSNDLDNYPCWPRIHRDTNCGCCIRVRISKDESLWHLLEQDYSKHQQQNWPDCTWFSCLCTLRCRCHRKRCHRFRIALQNEGL